MINKGCKHVWYLLKDSNYNPISGSEHPSKYQCRKCNSVFTGAEVYQLETLNYISGVQKVINIISLIISVIALLVSIFVLVYR